VGKSGIRLGGDGLVEPAQNRRAIEADAAEFLASEIGPGYRQRVRLSRGAKSSGLRPKCLDSGQARRVLVLQRSSSFDSSTIASPCRIKRLFQIGSNVCQAALSKANREGSDGASGRLAKLIIEIESTWNAADPARADAAER